MPQKTLPSKSPEEVFALTFQFGTEMQPGETIDGATVITRLRAGTDADPGAMSSSAPIVDGHDVYQTVRGGVSGARYGMVCLATTSLGRVLARGGVLPVNDAA